MIELVWHKCEKLLWTKVTWGMYKCPITTAFVTLNGRILSCQCTQLDASIWASLSIVKLLNWYNCHLSIHFPWREWHPKCTWMCSARFGRINWIPKSDFYCNLLQASGCSLVGSFERSRRFLVHEPAGGTGRWESASSSLPCGYEFIWWSQPHGDELLSQTRHRSFPWLFPSSPLTH